MTRLPLYTIVFLFIGIGVGICYWRHTTTGIPLTPGKQQTLWQVEARIDFNADNRPVHVSLELPYSAPGFDLVNEQAASPGYGFSVLEDANNRRGIWTKASASGAQNLFYKGYFVPSNAADQEQDEAADIPALTSTLFLNKSTEIAAEQVVSEARARSSSAQSYTRELLRILLATDPNQNAALLLDSEPVDALLVPLINKAGYQARLSEGLELEDARRRQRLQPWLEVYDQKWLFFDPRTGDQGLPENVLLWKRGGVSSLDVEGGTDSQLYFSMIEQSTSALSAARAESASVLSLLSISRLPIEEQSMFKLLLLLPLGALVVVAMRIFIGVRTAGTFMPVLIAVAFLQTSLVPGLVSFVLVVATGLLIRGYLSKLNMLLVARIATLVVIVVFMIALFSIIGSRLGLQTGMTITFFPMIILAWTIERMSILWEEEGPQEVSIQSAGSLVVAVVAYLLMSNPYASHLSFNFPEIHLITLAMIMMIGQYNGYRLSELGRFKRWEG